MARPPSTGRQVGVLALDDSISLALGKHLLARYFNAGLAADRPAKGRRKGEAYYAVNTNTLYAWDGSTWQTVAAGSSGHDPVTLAAAVEAVFGLSTQVLDFDTTQANKVLAGPASGGDAKPAMRALVATDIPGGTIPGPMGMPGFDGVDGVDGFPIPGPPGATGAAGPAGASVTGPPGPPGFGVDGEDGADGIPIVGPPGATGAAGASITGPPGLTILGIDGEDGQDGFPIPGSPGAVGATGAAGAAGASVVGPMGMPGMDGQDGEDGWPIPGPPGAASGAGDAATTTFTPTTLTDWDGAVDPGAVLGALDQLAERVRNASVFIPASAMWPSTAYGCAWPARREFPTNDVDVFYCAFDPAADEYAQFSLVLPVWDQGNITVTFFWTTVAAAGTTVCWGIAASSFANDQALETAFPAATEATDTVLAAGDVHIISTAAFAVGGAGAGEHVQFRIMRDVSEDNCASDADLLGVLITYGKRDA